MLYTSQCIITIMNPLRIFLLAALVLVVFGSGETEADEITLGLEGNYHLGGPAYDTKVSGDYAYVTTTSGIQVLDISDYSNPFWITSYYETTSMSGIDLKDDYIYVAAYSDGLYIFDISEPTNLQEVGSYKLFGGNEARDVVVIENYAFVVDYSEGLLVIDISDPTNPEKIGDYLSGTALKLAVVDDYAYIARGNGQFTILDISEPAEPQLVKNYNSGESQVWSVAVDGDYAYLGTTGEGVYIIDISDPTNPQEVSSYPIYDTVYDLKIIGDYLYVAGGQEGFFTLNVSDSTDPQILGEYTNNTGHLAPKAYGLMVIDDLVFLCKYTDGFLILDVSELSNPILLGTYKTDAQVREMKILDNYGYIAAGFGGLRIYDFSNPVNPQFISSYPIEAYVFGVTLRDSYAYITCWNQWSGYTGLIILDVTNPNNIQQISAYGTGTISYRTIIKEDYAYIANTDYGLLILDISDSTNPSFVGEYNTTGESYGVAIEGNYAYIADYGGGLVIVNISDPNNPELVSSYDTGPSAFSIKIVDNYAYVIDSQEGLIVIDISDPTSPEYVSSYDGGVQHTDIMLMGNNAYVSVSNSDDNEEGAVLIFNISSPGNPQLVGKYEDRTWDPMVTLAQSSTSLGEYVFVSGNNNLHELEIFKCNFNPIAKIESILPSPIRVGNEVSFIGSGYDKDGYVVNYEWESSINGFLSSGKEFSTNNLVVGTHTISLRVKDNDDLWSDWYNSQLIVNPNAAPEAIIDSIIPSPVRFDQEVIFSGNGTDSDGTVVAYQWKSSIDGELSTEQSFSLTGLSIGLHNISFKVQDNDGLWSTWNTTDLTVSPNSAPDAIIISITPSPARFDSEITFVGNGTDIDGTIASYEWESSIDGLLGSEKEFSMSGLSIGEHIIRLRVRDNDGAWSDWIMSEQSYNFIISGNSAPIAVIESISPSPSELGSEVIFSGSGFDSDGSIVEYLWTSSIDGNLSTEGNFSSNTLFVGTHNVTLRVKDNDGSWSEVISTQVLIYSVPIANAGDDLTVEKSTPIQFTGSGIVEGSSIVLYEWDFDGDGIYDWADYTGVLTYFYNKEGKYEVTLRITDTNGMTATDSIIITVIAKEEIVDNSSELENNEDDEGIPSISLVTSLISIGLLAIFRRK